MKNEASIASFILHQMEKTGSDDLYSGLSALAAMRSAQAHEATVNMAAANTSEGKNLRKALVAQRIIQEGYPDVYGRRNRTALLSGLGAGAASGIGAAAIPAMKGMRPQAAIAAALLGGALGAGIGGVVSLSRSKKKDPVFAKKINSADFKVRSASRALSNLKMGIY